MSTYISLPKSGMNIELTSLKSGDKDNSSALAGYQKNPENAESALETMKADKNLIVDLVSAIFRENIGEGERDNIINYLTLFNAWKKVTGEDGGALAGTSVNDLFFATWVNYTCCSAKFDNVKKISSYQALRDARVLCGLDGEAELNYEDYMVSCEALAGETLDFMATNADYTVKFMIRVPVVKVPGGIFNKEDRYRISNDKAKGFMYPNDDIDNECVIPTAELLHMIEENLKDKKKVRFTSEEAQKSLQEYVNTEDVHIEEILNVNSYLAVGTLGAENGLKADDLNVDDTKVTINEKDVYLVPHNSADVRGKNDIYDEEKNTVGGVTLTQRSETKYTLDSAKLYIVKLNMPDGMDVRSQQ